MSRAAGVPAEPSTKPKRPLLQDKTTNTKIESLAGTDAPQQPAPKRKGRPCKKMKIEGEEV